MLTKAITFFGCLLLFVASHQKTGEPIRLWVSDYPIPSAKEIPALKGVEFSVIKRYEPSSDGYRFLHGVAICFHNGRLYASYGTNRGAENTATEEAHYSVSDDLGKTWTKAQLLDREPLEGTGVSHGVFLSHRDELWAFHGAFVGDKQNVHTRAYRLDEAEGVWLPKGTVVSGGFWPMGAPQKMSDGNWIMPGFIIGEDNPPAVAISQGEDFLKWDLVKIRLQENLGEVWGESAVIVSDNSIINIARWGREGKALVAKSNDFGRTWSKSTPSDLPMTTSKPYSGTLSTGERYLICSIASDIGKRRAPLTIALSKPHEKDFSRLAVIRDAVLPTGPGESHPDASLAYPYAIEHEGKLYVAYSNNGGNQNRVGEGRDLWNNNSAELAIIPIESLRAAQ